MIISEDPKQTIILFFITNIALKILCLIVKFKTTDNIKFII
jgi:hypothetical protein